MKKYLHSTTDFNESFTVTFVDELQRKAGKKFAPFYGLQCSVQFHGTFFCLMCVKKLSKKFAVDLIRN